MAEILLETTIKREAGYLYYVATAKNGTVSLARAPMARGRTKKQ